MEKQLVFVVMFVVLLAADVASGARTRDVLLRSRRQQSCEFGMHRYRELMCCNCGPGQHREDYCSSSSGTKCLPCVKGTYMTHSNSKDSCEICSVCDKSANREIKEDCTVTSDTVCKCLEGFYCAEGDCIACHPCKECTHGTKEPCTEKKDAVCSEVTWLAGVLPLVLLVLLVLLACVVFYLKKKKKLCVGQKPENPESPQEVKMPLRPDVDLMQYATDIAEKLGYKNMEKVALNTGFTQIQLDGIRSDFPSDHAERTRRLLIMWIEHQDTANRCERLLTTLRRLNLKHSADEIEKMIRDGVAS
ncbi:tumor necrosis factor receptor superfamily member 6 [Denticeps clupeoides]|uniref:Tumor necrosis factor receptor superfamily member 6 n=1 Tax=Denticeps clupeoides TaxID=299321 RepID=A0AAY4C773_9TELE|nr:tumor necrosis factor receptor superfamily member 6-like [Denticeps clupeoides]